MSGWRRLFGRQSPAENVTVRAPAARAVSPRLLATGLGDKPGELLGGIYPVIRSLMVFYRPRSITGANDQDDPTEGEDREAERGDAAPPCT